MGYQSPCFPPMAVARHPVARIAPPAPAIISASRARVGERDGQRGNFPLILQCRQTPPPIRGASETERSQRSPSQNDTDVAGWRRVSCWSRRGALGPSSPARRRIFGDRSAPTNIDVGHRPLPHTAPHKLLPPVGHPAGRSRMLVAVHGLALRSASDAIRAPLTELLKPDGCRAPPRSSHRAAGARNHQHLARASG